MKLFDRILVPTDFSAASRPAVAEAMRIARATGAELLLVNAYESPGTTAFGPYVVSATLYDEIEAALRSGAEKGLRPLVEKARKAGVKAKPEILMGIPAAVITDAATAFHADLIVMGTHGRGAVSQFLLGSVAQKVIATAPCAVMTICAANTSAGGRRTKKKHRI